jgi:eukaryotic-like serine/threonine-protein kinase
LTVQVTKRQMPPRPFAETLPEDGTPGPQASLPGMSAWSDGDAGLVSGPRAVFSTNPPGRPAGELPSIGHIGRYALKYRIGEGGLGMVYAAHDPMLSRLVAIKTVHVQVAPAELESFNALFLNEARAAAGLSHPHIVTVFDAGLSEGGAYIAMELLKGVDLRQLRLEGWQPAPAQTAQLVLHVADALAYAHSHGVVHRDVKPANIFMVGRAQPRVLDFGIARVTHHHDVPPEQELSGGSPYYMAPEQVLQQSVDARCDVFSLGVVMYELLTGVRPFRGETLAQIHRAVLEHRPPPAHEVAPAVPKALAQIAARAMVTDPEGRYPSAAAMARELRHWLETRELAAEPPAPPQSASRRRWIAAAAVSALLLAAGGGWFAISMRGAPAGAVAPAPATLPKGLVQIEVSPWAQVEVNGIGVGTAPPLNQLALPEGRHTITLRHADAPPYSVSVDVALGQPVVVAHRFEP